MASIPTPIRATLGLLATALDAVQELVDHAPEIPMEAVGNSMQLSLRLQQHYVALLTRGDEFLASLRGAPEEPPAWATFDEPPPSSPAADTPTDTAPPSADGRSSGDGLSTEDVLSTGDALSDGDGLSTDAVDDLPDAEIQDAPRHAGQGDPLLAAATRGRPSTGRGPTVAKKAAKVTGTNVSGAKAAGAKAAGTKAAGAKAAGAKAAGTKAAGRKAAAKKAAPAAAPAHKAPARKVGAKKAAAKKAPAKRASAKVAASVEATPARKTPTARSTRTAKGSAPSPPVLDPAMPIPAPAAPAKRGRPAKKAAPLEAATAPRLDASLTAGAASARPRSAFDLTDTPPDARTTGPGTTGPGTGNAGTGDAGLSALAGGGVTEDGVGPSTPEIP